jgi:dipeptidyl aminopeptidase/acylaminoacyl peptidase
MDLDRVGIMGSSGGGYATVRALAEFPDFFKAGVAMCGNHDQSSYISAWGDCFQGLHDTARYATQDNQSIAGRIEGDLLLIHGEMDDNVHPAMTLRVVDALIKADRNFEMLIVPGAGHLLGPLPYVERRIWDFLVRRLMGVEPPRPGQRNTGIPS